MKTHNKKHITKLLGTIYLIFALSQPVMAAPIELSLEDSFALALKNNADLKIAQTSREKTNWTVKQAEANKSVGVSLAHTDTRYGSPVTMDDNLSSANKFNNQLALTVPVYSGGKLESQIEQAKLDLSVAELTIDRTKQNLRQTVTSCYFNVLQYYNEVKVNQETVANYAAHLKHVQDQYRIGTVAKSDVLSSQVELANAEDTLLKAQSNYQVAVANLNNVVGLPLDSELTLKEELKYETYPATLEECIQSALASRPELAEYQAKITSAQKDVKIAKSGNLPTVEFSLAQNWYDKDFPGLSNGNWQATLTTSLNLFDSGLTKSKVRQSRYNLETIQEQARQQQDTVLLEVREYYISLREAEKRIDIKKVAVEQAEESLKIAEARYKAGVGTNLAVFDAVVALNQAKLNNIKALYDYNTSKAQLEKAIAVTIDGKRG